MGQKKKIGRKEKKERKFFRGKHGKEIWETNRRGERGINKEREREGKFPRAVDRGRFILEA